MQLGCPKCPSTFGSSDLLKIHFRTLHKKVKAHENKPMSGNQADRKYVDIQSKDLSEITNESDNVEDKVLDVSAIPKSVHDVAAHGLKISDFFSYAGTSVKGELGAEEPIQDMAEENAVDDSPLDAKAPLAHLEEMLGKKAVNTSLVGKKAPISLLEKMLEEKALKTPQEVNHSNSDLHKTYLEEMLKENALKTPKEVNQSNDVLHKTYLQNMKYTDHFRCQDCNYRSKNRLNIISHYQVTHGVTAQDKESSGDEMRPIPSKKTHKIKNIMSHLCKLCNFGAKTRIGVSNHIRVKHKQEIKKVKYTTEFVKEVKVSSQEQRIESLKVEGMEMDSTDDKFEFTFVGI